MIRGASFWKAACLAPLLLAGCATTPPEQDPVQIKLNDLDTRLARIERVVTNQSLLGLSNEIDALRADLRAMHNDVDELGHNLELARKQTHDLYADLDQRIKALEGRGAAPVGAAPETAAGSAPTAGQPAADGADQAGYQAAFTLLKDGRYDQAIASFQKFLVSNPDSSLADNAQYWLGEAYYVQKSFPEAMASFQRVVDEYTQSRKLPDALLKIAYCDYELKQYSAARDLLSEVVAKFPSTAAGYLAQQRLEKMAAEKR